MLYKGLVKIKGARMEDVIKHLDCIKSWANMHNVTSIKMEEADNGISSDRYDVIFWDCECSVEEISRTNLIGNLYLHIYEGELIEKEYDISPQDSELASFVLNFIEQNQMDEDARKTILNMPLIKFCDMFKGSGVNEKKFNMPKDEVLHNLSSIACPVCRSLGLRVIDGVISCRSCHTVFGDVDELGEII